MSAPELFLSGRVALHCGDSREVLRALPDASIHAVVTDPPYALVSIRKRFGAADAAPAQHGRDGLYARASAGFMGKDWDTGETAFAAEFWSEVLRVLKPGGHVVAFSGTRTYHRLACAIEDAGFEIRDQLAWAYGCLDDQTMAVTHDGVMPYHKIKKGDLVLSYDPSYMTYEWQPVEEVLVYDVDDIAYRISTDFGDQLVSRNHRCIVERGGEEAFEFAEEAARQREIRVPVLEDLRALLDAVSGAHKGAGGAEQDVFGGVHEGNPVGEARGGGETSGNARGKIAGDVHSMRGAVLAKRETPEARHEGSLQLRVQRSASRAGVEGARAYRAGELDAGVGIGSSGEDDRRDESRLERRRDLQESEGELRVGSIRAMPGRISPNVSQGRVCDGASPECGDGDWSASDEDGMRASHRPRSAEQHARKPDAFRDEQGPQAVRAWRGHKTVVGRITPERYRGVIWCVRVKSGAFVAVRNGFAFPTGNSGFPKSHDVAKAIDKLMGAERVKVRVDASEVRNPKATGGGKDGRAGASRPWIEAALDRGYHEKDGDAPASAEAAAWEGWGTALKPAWEPIILARKPLEGTVAANVLAHGSGALNIDGCRVESEKPTGWGGGAAGGNTWNSDNSGLCKSGEARPVEGRWPANIVHDGSPEVILAFPETGASKAGGRSTGRNFGQEADSSFAKDRARTGHDDLGGSAASFFYQVEKDDRCDLCRVLLSGKNVKHLSCDAITAKPNSQIPNTQVEGTAHFDAAASQQPERGGKKLPSSSHVHVAGNRSEQCHQRRDNTALSDALTLEASRIAPSVRSAANLCGSCETDIAQSLAATRLGLDPASLRCLEFMPEHEGKILSQHLALYVAGRESIDTITTTASLKTLFGSVFHAIADTTNSEKAEGEENTGRGRRLFYSSKADADDRLGSKHPTVKPVNLMQWLCRLVCPPGGTVLDPFAGTGTTGEAAWREGFSAVLIEREAEYQADIRRRMALCLAGPEERKREAIKARHGDLPAGPLFADPEAAE